MKNLKTFLTSLIVAVVFPCVGQEQDITLSPTPVSIQPLSLTVDDMLEVKSLSDDQLTAFVSSLNVTPQISFDALPRQGIGQTYFSLQHPEWPPLPGDTAAVPVWQMDGFLLLNDLNHNYNPPLARHMRTSFSAPAPGDGSGDSGTNSPSPNVTILPNYGTNLWIAQVNIVSNNLTGIASNTLSDVQYEIQTKTNLLQTNWLSTGSFILGSEITNWTTLNPLPVILTNNFFVRLKSWASSNGSGLPDWWQLQYFGTNGVDPYGNPAGDGWSNLQKFQNGMNPNVFYTPAAPQGVTARLNAANGTAKISWLPAAGSVTGYTVSDSDGNSFNVSATTTTYTDNISGDALDVFNGNTYDTSYQVRANYAAGNSPWSDAVLLQSSVVNGSIIAGQNGQYYLAIADVPTEVVTARLVYIVTHDNRNTFLVFTNHDISISAFTNGYYPLPASWLPPQDQGDTNYFAYVQGLDAGGNGGAATYLLYVSGSKGTFHDGRIQLKQNVIFLLRSALKNYPFSVLPGRISNGSFWTESSPYSTNYVYSSIWTLFFDVFDENYNYVMELDAEQPFMANTMFRNFVFDTSNLNSSGAINTGASGSFSGQQHTMAITSPTYQFVSPLTNWSTIPAALSNSQWLCSFPISDSHYDQIGISKTAPNYFLGNNISNVYGLPFVSTKVAYNGGSGVVTATFTPGGSTTHGSYFYPETAQPTFQTVEYDFWIPGYGTGHSYLPGEALFSTTNKSAFFLVTPGQAMSIAGYAKLAIQNGYANRFAYLGQYFDKAYKIGTNGLATTNTTGFLTPYGDFFATEPGPTALVTMPDVDTGARGTCTVYSVSISVDANHDGNMDVSFNGADATASTQPFTFWINNNHDRSLYDRDDGTNYEDDLNSIDIAQLPYYQQVPDYNFTNSDGYRAIPSKRDLEDFTRLWVNGITSNLLAALPSGSTVTLSWGDVGSPNSANPTIDLFQAADADGGIGYLTNSTSAGAQTNLSLAPYIGRLGPGNSIELKSPTATNLLGNHFIWCGVAKGTGQLFLTIADSSGNVLAQSKFNIQIKDIKNMYERWTVGDEPGQAPYATATLAANDLPSPTQRLFQYAAPEDTNTPYILFVHGWNMRQDDKDHFAETAFKRLYWQGYQGRFGSFRWPTTYGFNSQSYINVLLNIHNYDNGEFQAWQSAQGLVNKLQDLNTEYPGHVYMLAHSMGNVVAGEALRLAAQNGDGQLVNTYAANQAAIPAHVYDASVTSPYLIDYTLVAHGVSAPGHPNTPNIYGNRLTNTVVAAGRRINFYNVNDYALNASAWCWDQEHKPDTFLTGYYYYAGPTSDPAPWNNFRYDYFIGTYRPLDIVNSVSDRYETLAYAANPYSTALGATPGIVTFDDRLDLTTLWPPDTDPRFQLNPYSEHFWHSAEFRGDYWQEWNYWQTLLHSTTLGFNINN